MVRAALTAGVLVLALAGCSSPKKNAPPVDPPGRGCLLVPPGMDPRGGVAIRVETVISGLEVPWGIAFLPGGDWLVTERPGRVRLVSQGALVADPVVTVDVVNDGESGLLGIAVSPRFASDHLFYVYGTFQGAARENRVVRY